MKKTSEEYLDSLLNRKISRKRRPSSREFLIDNQGEVPVWIMIAWLDANNEKAVINDGRIIKFTTR